MVKQLVLFATLLALSMGCGCQKGLEFSPEELGLDPSSALDFFRGFVYGSQDSQCYYTPCFVNTTYAVSQVQSIITTIESLINNFNPANLLPIICNFNTIFQDYQALYSLCNVGGLINSAKALATTAGLKAAAMRTLLDLEYFYGSYLIAGDCGTQVFTCGYTFGEAWSTLSNWKVTNVTTVEDIENEIDIHVFLDGLIEGYGQEDFIAVGDSLNEFVRIAFNYIHGDFNQIHDLTAHYTIMKEKYESLNWPTFEPTTVFNKMMFSQTQSKAISEKIEACEGDHQCGLAFGELLAFFLN